MYKICLIEEKNKQKKYTIYNKLLDSPKKNIEYKNNYILEFLKKDYKNNLNK